MAAGNTNRSARRTRQIGFRMSDADLHLLRAAAADAGVSLQAYLEAKVFDRPFQELTGGRPAKHQQELPLTG